MNAFLGLGAALLGVLLGATLSYVCGRIILPEMGLQAPGFGPWFVIWCIGAAMGLSVSKFSEWLRG